MADVVHVPESEARESMLTLVDNADVDELAFMLSELTEYEGSTVIVDGDDGVQSDPWREGQLTSDSTG